MREILFRGKRKDNGEWIQGDLRHWNNGVGIHSDILHHTIKVDSETVGQFTGLVDKAGKRIFEGDILRCFLGDYTDIGVVQYDDRIAAYIVLFADGVLTFLDFFTAKVETWREVIGNIHDNQEFRKEGEFDG